MESCQGSNQPEPNPSRAGSGSDRNLDGTRPAGLIINLEPPFVRNLCRIVSSLDSAPLRQDPSLVESESGWIQRE
eukprot:6366945-Pyramimonas_sp.AAC.1